MIQKEKEKTKQKHQHTNDAPLLLEPLFFVVEHIDDPCENMLGKLPLIKCVKL